ncbi:signal peptide peptidase SppA [Candidatus Erwinia haradaeae]|uniref:Protease 4 n=1 Tax=Candidatus Erwinia haradaeae TaxID=1922217 RepID=A0A451D1I8_9GAMM|nr:signal peptide peptidase SppA [Candidatus Erwinia haradaeae]VFP79471.1 Protease 4 [Candidatus Erwinia haradaeae]
MHTLWQVFTTTLFGTWRAFTLVRQFIFNLLFLLLIGVGIFFWFQNERINPVGEKNKGALIINLHGKIVDQPAHCYNVFSQVSHQILGCNNNDDIKENSLFDIVNLIRQAKNDSNISGIVLDLRHFIGGDQASLEYIGKTLKEFRNSGKPIVSTGFSYSQGQYYLASFANKIYLSPQGNVDLRGFSSNNMYYKTLLDKLKINSHVFRVGAYKSAVEPFLRDDMSPEARDVAHHVVSELWNNYLQTIAENRKVSTTQIFPGEKKIIEKLTELNGDTAQYAKDNKLVDELASPVLVEKALIDIFGWDSEKKNYRGVKMYDYRFKDTHPGAGNIGVIVVNGELMDGEKTLGRLSCDTTALELRSARLDPQIKAVILRVNSPGGDLVASEIIRAELQAVKDAGKPVIVSMGGMAASGGYFISAPANYIIANKNTLTGSIGIFSVVHTIENTLDAIGIHTDGVRTSNFSETTSTKSLSDDVQKIIQLNVNHGYQSFIRLVAQERHKTLEEIDRVAQGRVWMGCDAKLHGLVDSIGDFDDAILKAVELSHLHNPILKWYRDKSCVLETILSQFSDTKKIYFLNRSMNDWLPLPLSDIISDFLKKPGMINNSYNQKNSYALCLSYSDIK